MATKATKRKVADISDEVDKSAYHPHFPLYPEADLVVESSSGTLFATRALYLRSTSSVFDDILSLPPQDQLEKKDGLAIIKIEEEDDVFEIFLRYAHRGRLLVDGQPPSPSWNTVLLLSKLFDKYDSSDLVRSFLIEQLPRFIQDPLIPAEIRGAGVVAGTNVPLPLPVNVFAVASIHHIEDLAKRSIRWSLFSGVRSPGTMSLVHIFRADPRATVDDWRPNGIGDMDLDLLSRVPVKAVHQFCMLHSKVVSTPGYTWIKAGDDFQL